MAPRKVQAARLVHIALAMWIAVRFVNSFIHHAQFKRGDIEEARLLVSKICNTKDVDRVRGRRIDCDGARRDASAWFITAFYAADNAAYDVFIGSWRTATSEVVGVLNLLSIGTAVVLSILMVAGQGTGWVKSVTNSMSRYGEGFVDAVGIRRGIPVHVKEA
jgi:hypothetical protein